MILIMKKFVYPLAIINFFALFLLGTSAAKADIVIRYASDANIAIPWLRIFILGVFMVNVVVIFLLILIRISRKKTPSPPRLIDPVNYKK
jgi:hypothetical protein